MAGLLSGVSPYDLSTFAGVTAVLTAVAIAARHVPALRAMRLDPITTLRMTFGTARDLSLQVVAIPMTSFGMLMVIRDKRRNHHRECTYLQRVGRVVTSSVSNHRCGPLCRPLISPETR
jgi:hypothetical protein